MATGAQIGSLYATIDADMRGLERGIHAARAKLSEFGKNLDGIKGGAAAAGRGLDDLGQNMEQLGKKTGHAHGASKGFFGDFKMGLSMMAGGFAAAQIGISAVQKGMSALAGAAIGVNARLEQAKVGFTTMLGSATAAHSFVKEMYRFAAETPFEFEGLLQNTQLLKAMGFEAKDLIPLMADVGDAMAAMGRSGIYIDRVVLALGQMNQKGRLMGQEALQLAEAGINIYGILADQMGKTAAEVRDLGEAGEISAEMAIGAFRDFVQKNYGGAMAAQAKTAAGAFTTLSDSIKMFIATAAEPGFKALSSLVVGSAALGQSEGAESWAKRFAAALQAAVDTARSQLLMLKAVVDFIKETNVETTPRPDEVGMLGSVYEYAAGKIGDAVESMTRLGRQERELAEVDAKLTEQTGALYKSMVALEYELAPTTAGFREQADAIQANIRASGQMIDSFNAMYDLLYDTKALYERLPWAQGPGLADMAKAAAGASFGSVMAGYDNSARQVTKAQEVIKSQLDAIGDRISAVGRHAQDVAAAYDAQTQALQEQIDLVTKADPVKTEKDLQYQLKRNAIEQELLSAREGSYREKRLKKQLESLDKEARQNRLLMEQEAIQGRIAAIPLEEKLKGILKQRDAELKAIQDSATAMGRQRDVLQEQLDKVGSVKTVLAETDPILDANYKRALAWREESDKLLANYQAIKETAASMPTAAPDMGDPFSKGRAAAAGQGGLRNPFDWIKGIYQSTRQGVGYDTPKGWQPHDWGVDWAMPFGTKLKAIGEGVVSQIIEGYNSGFGNTMVVTLANGMKAFYSHLSGFAKKVGDRFNLGDIIASSGGLKSIQGAGAGESTGAHLDFRLMQDNKYLNVIKTLAQGLPIPFIRGQGGGVGGETGALDAAANAAAALADIAKLFKEIGKFADVPTAAIDKLLAGVQAVMERLNALRGKWEPKTVEDLGNFSDGVAYVFAPLKEALEFLDGLANLSAIKKGAIPKFFNKLAVIISEMNALKVGALISGVKVGALGEWAERLAPTFAPLKDGLSVLAGLAELPAFKRDMIPKFFDKLAMIISEMNALKVGLAISLPDIDLSKLARWAKPLADIFAPIANAVQGLSSLVDFKRPGEKVLIAFRNSLKRFLVLMKQLSKDPLLKKHAMKVAAEIAKNWGEILNVLGSAGGLKDLGEFKAPGEGQLQAFKASLKRFLVLMKELARDPAFEGEHQLDKAVSFANKANTIVTLLNSSMDGFAALKEKGAAPAAALEAVVAGLAAALNRMDEMVEWSKQILDRATQVRDNLLEAVKRLTEGLNAWYAAPTQILGFAPTTAGASAANATNLNVQRITINTAATDAEGIAGALMYELENVNYRMGRKASRRMRTMVR